MTVGYAAFQTNLDIKGTSKVSSNWNVLITNVTESNKEGQAETVGSPSWTDLTAYMEANLYQKGDYVEYEVTVENRGTLDAKLESITDNIKTTNEAIKISFTGYTKGEKLYKNTSKKIIVKIEYNPEFNGTIEEGSSEISIDLNYTQNNDYQNGEGGEITSPERYLVTYDCTSNGGKECTRYNEYLKEGERVNLTEAAEKEGYTFVGWNTNKDSEEGLTQLEMPSEDIILYAIYKKELKVTYAKGENITSISKEQDSCYLYNKNTTCEITLPSITANDGYGVDGWYDNNIKIDDNKYQVSSNITLDSKAIDNIKPTISLNPNTQTTYVKSKAVTVNLADAGSGLKASQNIYYAWSTSNTTVPNYSSYVTTSNAAGAKTASVTIPATSNSSLTGSYYLWIKVGTLSDVAGNTSAVKTSAVFKFDNTKPTVSLNPNTQTTYVTSKAVTVNLADSHSGLKASQKIYYAWSTSNTTAPSYSAYVTTTNAAGATSASVTVPTTSNSTLTGTYYLWIKVGTLSDVAGNTSNQVVSALFRFDNKVPSLSIATSKTTKSITVVSTASATSGIAKYEFSNNGGSSWVNGGTNKTYTFNGLKNNTAYNIRARVTSGVSKQTTSATTSVTTNNIAVPTYKATKTTTGKTVTVTFPSGCGSTYTCTYKKDSGAEVKVTSTSASVAYTAPGTLVGKVSDGTNTVSSSYTVTIDNGFYTSGSCKYFMEGGKRVTGWLCLKNGSSAIRCDTSEVPTSQYWYYSASDGCAKTGWQTIAYTNPIGITCSSKYFWFDSTGRMATGWRQINGTWYYFALYNDTEYKWNTRQVFGCMYTGWVYSEEYNCASHGWYFNSNGALATNTTINGSYVDSSGCWIQ